MTHSNLMYYYLLKLHNFIAKPLTYSQEDVNLGLVFYIEDKSVTHLLWSDTKSVAGAFVLTHRFWSCTILGCMHCWPVWANCFQWCGFKYRVATAISLSHGGMRRLLTSLGLSWPRLWRDRHASLRGQTQVKGAGVHEAQSHRLLHREIRNLIWWVLMDAKNASNSDVLLLTVYYLNNTLTFLAPHFAILCCLNLW